MYNMQLTLNVCKLYKNLNTYGQKYNMRHDNTNARIFWSLCDTDGNRVMNLPA